MLNTPLDYELDNDMSEKGDEDLMSEFFDYSGDGLMGDGKDLIRNLQMAWYYYNESQLYNNLDTLVVNYALKLLDEKGAERDDEKLEDLQDKLKTILTTTAGLAILGIL